MATLVKGKRYRLVRDMHEPQLPVGAVFTYIDSVAYFDWFKCVVELDGARFRVGYGLGDFCEPVDVDRYT